MFHIELCINTDDVDNAMCDIIGTKIQTNDVDNNKIYLKLDDSTLFSEVAQNIESYQNTLNEKYPTKVGYFQITLSEPQEYNYLIVEFILSDERITHIEIV